VNTSQLVIRVSSIKHSISQLALEARTIGPQVTALSHHFAASGRGMVAISAPGGQTE